MQRATAWVTCCVHSTAGAIRPMVDAARQIQWETFRRHVPVELVREVFPFYSYRGEQRNPATGEQTCPFHLKDDWAVSFHSSRFNRRPCWYIRHSAIEYIFA